MAAGSLYGKVEALASERDVVAQRMTDLAGAEEKILEATIKDDQEAKRNSLKDKMLEQIDGILNRQS